MLWLLIQIILPGAFSTGGHGSVNVVFASVNFRQFIPSCRGWQYSTPETESYNMYTLNGIFNYSLAHIFQITDFRDFLREHCEEKSENFTEF